MKITKGKLSFGICCALLLIVVNIVAFAAPFLRLPSFWVGYGFALLALVLAFAASLYILRDSSPKSRFYGLPAITILWIYVILQVVFSFVCMAFSALPVWVSLIISVLLLAFSLIGLVTLDVANDAVKQVDSHVNEKVYFMKSLQRSVAHLAAQAQDPALKKQLQTLAESIRFSDPMSSPQLIPLENEMASQLSSLETFLSAGDIPASIAACAHLEGLLTQRSRQCLLLK